MSRTSLASFVALCCIFVTVTEADAGIFRKRCGLRARLRCQPVACTTVNAVADTPTEPAPRIKLMIEETYEVRRRLPDGRIVAETRTRSRPATPTEAINALLDQIDQLDVEVFGGEQVRKPSLEERVDKLENRPNGE